MAMLALYWSIMIACYLIASKLRRHADKFHFLDALTNLFIYFLIFLMGLRMGADEEVTSSLGSIGVQALFVTLLTAVGSMLGATAARKIVHLNRHSLPAGTEEEGAEEHGGGVNTTGIKSSVIMLGSVGFSMGLDGSIVRVMRGAGLGVVLVPIFSVIGSLLAGVVYALLSPVTLREGLAISAGFGWYTMAPSVISGAGHAVAGAISFLHNVLRETMGLIFLPLIASKIGYIEAITLPGTASTDLCLPLVEKYCNPETMAYSFCTGMLMCITSAALVPIIIGA